MNFLYELLTKAFYLYIAYIANPSICSMVTGLTSAIFIKVSSSNISIIRLAYFAGYPNSLTA